MSPSSTQTPQRGTGRGIGIRTAAGSDERAHGQLHVYDGDGKGKSQAALGVVLRTIGLGICEQKRTRVLLLRFLKGPGRAYDEDAAIEALQQGFPHLIDQVRTGRGDFFTAEEATKLIDAAVAELGPTTDLLDSRSLVRLARGQTRQALEDATDAVLLQPSPRNLLHLALIRAEIKDLEGAREAFSRAIEKGLKEERLSPDDRRRLKKVEGAIGAVTPSA